MEATSGIHRVMKVAARPAALAIAVLVLLAAASFDAEPARAQPVLMSEAFCEPDPVRPDVPVLISCTTRLTNEGDETATNLVASIGPASSCAIPSRFAFIDRTVNGELVAISPSALSIEIGDLAPGETYESVTRVAVENFSTGLVGGSVTVSSTNQPGWISDDICWEVTEDAEAPPTNLEVTKTLLTEFEFPPFEPFPEPPPPPEDAAPVPIEQPPAPSGPEQAEFEIVVSNVSDAEMADVTVLDVPSGDAVLVSAEPPTSGTDPLGRPIWDLGALGPGEEVGILATFGPPPDGDCSFANDLAIVTATPAGGEPEDYVAFADFGIPVGPCEFEEPSLCWHYPPEGEPTIAPCEVEVCWAAPPDGGPLRSVYDCDPDVEYCWFLPPGEGYTALRPCAEEVCWFSYGEGDFDSYFFDVPCEIEFCEFTAPDGSTTFRDYCDFPVCWSSAPGSGEWRTVWGCGEFEDLCWFSPPGDGEPVLRSCAQEICWFSFGESDFPYDVACDFEFCEFTAPDGSTSSRGSCDFPVCWSTPPGNGFWSPVWGCGEFEDWCWFSPPGDSSQPVLNPCEFPLRFAVNPPEGSVDFGFGPWAVYSDEDWCWPVPDDGGPFFTFPIFCDGVEFITWFFPPNDGPAFPMFEMTEACWQPVPTDIELPPGAELPPDLLIPGPCAEGEEPKTGQPGSSVPAEVVDADSTPAEIVEGTVEQIEPLPSADVTPAEIVEGTVEIIEPLPSEEVIPAELIRSERTEPAPPDVIVPVEEPDRPSAPGDGVDEPEQPAPEVGQPPTLPELLGFGPDETAPAVDALPDSGTGLAGGGDFARPWALAGGLAATGLLLASIAVQMRRRRSL